MKVLKFFLNRWVKVMGVQGQHFVKLVLVHISVDPRVHVVYFRKM